MLWKVLVIHLVLSQQLYGICASLVKGPMAFDVQSCGVLNPVKTFPLTQDRYQFIADLSNEDRLAFYNSYRGLYVKGQVAKSFAVRSGLSPKRGALGGEIISVYIPPGVATCRAIKGKRIKAMMEEACCEGGGDAPCLLDTTYVFTSAEAIGASGGASGDKKRMQAATNQEFQKANYYLKNKNFEAAAELYAQLLVKNQLDLRGHFFLGFAYRMLDQCNLAIPVLQKIFDASEKNDTWANDESVVRKSNMLLARCHSKTGNADRAVLVLESFLLSPEKYRPEIQLSLTHPDFGRIQTAKVYLEYRKNAVAAMNR